MSKANLIPLMTMLVAGCATPDAAKKQTLPSAKATKGAEKEARKRAPKAPVALKHYFDIRRVGGLSFSHDEKLVAYASDKGGRMDIWVQPIGGGEERQITKVKGFVHSFAFSPTADKLVYEADAGGNELPHIYLTDSKGSGHTDLMAKDPKGARTGFAGWAKNGKTFLYTSNRRDRRFLDLYEYELATGRSTLLWRSSGRRAFAMASRDHRSFAVLETLSDVNNNLYLVRRGKKGKPTLLTQHEGDARYQPTGFSPDGKTLFYKSDAEGEFFALYSVNLRNRKTKKVLSEKWDVDAGRYTRGGRYFFTLTNVDGTFKASFRDVKKNAPAKLPTLPGGAGLVVVHSSKSDRYLGGYLLTDTAPTSLYVIDMEKQNLRKLVEVLPKSLAERPMVAGKSVRVPSFDKWKVPAFVYTPERAEGAKGLLPAVIDVHGGPTYQSRRNFKGFRQYLVSKGYVVMVPNVRGSTGYGKTYTQLDNLDLGGGPLKDIVHCKRWLVKHANVDPKRVVVMGGSYGGYMALAAATFTPEEFAANVDFFGVSDLKSLVESFPPYWAAFATFIHKKFGDPRNPAHAKYQHDRSPINFVDKIVRPLLVVQGENDARVKKDQSDRIVDKLKGRKVPVHYLVIKGEGHGFSKTANRILAYERTDRFLDRYLFGDTSVELD